MKGFTLTVEEIQELRAAHREAIKRNDARAAYKLNAVILLGTSRSNEEEDRNYLRHARHLATSRLAVSFPEE